MHRKLSHLSDADVEDNIESDTSRISRNLPHSDSHTDSIADAKEMREPLDSHVDSKLDAGSPEGSASNTDFSSLGSEASTLVEDSSSTLNGDADRRSPDHNHKRTSSSAGVVGVSAESTEKLVNGDISAHGANSQSNSNSPDRTRSLSEAVGSMRLSDDEPSPLCSRGGSAATQDSSRGGSASTQDSSRGGSAATQDSGLCNGVMGSSCDMSDKKSATGDSNAHEVFNGGSRAAGMMPRNKAVKGSSIKSRQQLRVEACKRAMSTLSPR